EIAEGPGDRDPDLAHDATQQAVARGVVDDALFADHVASQRIDSSETVHEPEPQRVLAAPEQAAEQVLVAGLQAFAATVLDRVDELAMDGVEQTVGEFDVGRVDGQERVERPLEL